MTNFSNYFNSKENKTDFFIAIIVVILFIALGGFLMTNNNFEVIEDLNTSILSQNSIKKEIKTTSNTSVYIDKKIINEPQVVSWIDSLEHNDVVNTSTNVATVAAATSNNVVSNTDSLSIETENTSKEVIEDLDSSNKPKINLNFNGSDKKEIKSKIAENTKIEPTETLIEPQVEGKKVIIPTKKAIKQKSEINKSNPIIKKEAITKTKCVVILGAFSSPNNLNNLKKTVLKDYSLDEIYLGKRKGYNVLGIHVNCASAENKLNSLRKKYVEKAWLLKLK